MSDGVVNGAAVAKQQIADGKDKKTGQFIKGHKISAARPILRTQQARRIFEEKAFDPLEERVDYFQALRAEADMLEANLAKKLYIDPAGFTHSVLILETDPATGKIKKTKQPDNDKVEWVRGRMASLRADADRVAASLVGYVHPKLGNIEVQATPSTETFAALMLQVNSGLLNDDE